MIFHNKGYEPCHVNDPQNRSGHLSAAKDAGQLSTLSISSTA
jgi:hypothetical protein